MIAMPKASTVQRLWNQFDHLKVTLFANPNIQIKKAQKIVKQMERTIKKLRVEEIHESK